MDGDGDIDFAEWRKELKARGYSDLEIETVFAKYDQDGDKVTGIWGGRGDICIWISRSTWDVEKVKNTYEGQEVSCAIGYSILLIIT